MNKKEQVIDKRLWPLLVKTRVAKLLGIHRNGLYYKYSKNKFNPYEIEILRKNGIIKSI